MRRIILIVFRIHLHTNYGFCSNPFEKIGTTLFDGVTSSALDGKPLFTRLRAVTEQL